MESFILVIVITIYTILLSFGIICIRQDIDEVMKEIKEIKRYYERT